MAVRGPIAFQGEHGAYGEEAAGLLYPGEPVLPVPTFAAAFEAVAAGRAPRAVVPAENSWAGSVHEVYDLLLRFPLLIVAECILPVRHCLLALPGQRLADVQEVWSHPQAIAQCKDFLRAHGFRAVAAADTAGSARAVAEKRRRGVAAIAGRAAAARYGLEILAEDVQAAPDNATRFLALATEPAPATGAAKSSLVLATDHRPGALYHCLGALAEAGVNLTKLESRPTRQRPWEYLFYLDFEGHQAEPRIAGALEELGRRAAWVRLLGSYPRAG